MGNDHEWFKAAEELNADFVAIYFSLRSDGLSSKDQIFTHILKSVLSDHPPLFLNDTYVDLINYKNNYYKVKQ